MYYEQADFDIRCEWGIQGITKLSPITDIIIIVDVMSFSTCVDIAVNHGAVVFPYRWKDETAIDYANLKNAQLASFERCSSAKFSLSPSSLLNIPEKTRLVLPSPNGSTLSLATMGKITLTGCLRNCHAVAQYATNLGASIAVIPAGEKWEDGSLRPSIEDLIGAGAIINYLPGNKSPEALTALSVFQSVQSELMRVLLNCSSGKELIERGFKLDVELASQLNCSYAIPILQDECYVNNSVDFY